MTLILTYIAFAILSTIIVFGVNRLFNKKENNTINKNGEDTMK